MKTGTKVLLHGYSGVITYDHTGDADLDGMVEVKLASGMIIVPRADCKPL